MTQHGSHPTDICSERETDVFGGIQLSHFGNMNIAESVDLGRKPLWKNKQFHQNTDGGAERAAGGHYKQDDLANSTSLLGRVRNVDVLFPHTYRK